MDTTYIRKTKPNGRTYYARNRITPRQKLLVQQVVGSLLYYALAVDCTLLVALGDLAAVQTRATKATMDKLVWLRSLQSKCRSYICRKRYVFAYSQ